MCWWPSPQAAVPAAGVVIDAAEPLAAQAFGDAQGPVSIVAVGMVHGGQEFRWGPLVVAGDEIETAVVVQDISERDGRGFYVFTSTSTNQRGEIVCVGTWTNIVREA